MTDREPPIVLIPGIQGRWEWMAPAVDALAESQHVLTASLEDLGDTTVPEQTFDAWAAGIDALLDRAGVRRACVAGVSFGGLIAVSYAAARPDRVSGLVLVSTPAPRWRDDHPAGAYLRHPRLSVPQFVAGAVGRLLPELRASLPGWPSRVVFLTRHFGRILRFPASPARMASRVRAWMATDIVAASRRVTAPTLVITGQPALDRVVPVDDTRQYVTLIPGARHAILDATGHVGLITRPAAFAALVSSFARESAAAPSAAINKAG